MKSRIMYLALLLMALVIAISGGLYLYNSGKKAGEEKIDQKIAEIEDKIKPTPSPTSCPTVIDEFYQKLVITEKAQGKEKKFRYKNSDGGTFESDTDYTIGDNIRAYRDTCTGRISI